MAEQKDQGHNQAGHDCNCPFCALFGALKDCADRNADIIKHLKNAETEVLMAVRGMIDKRLEEKQEEPGKKATKIKVE